MKSAAHRIAAYNARMQSSLIDPTLSAKQTLQTASFANHIAEFYPNQVAMRAILDAAGVGSFLIASYEAFHGELFHLWKSLSGDALVTAAGHLVNKWSDTNHLGAGAEATLMLICEDVYHIIFTATP